MPQRDQQLTSQRHDANLVQPRAASAKPFLIPLAESAVGLMTQPAPGDLDGHGPNQGVTSFADALFMVIGATLKGRRRQPGQRPNLAAIMEVAPAEELQMDLDQRPILAVTMGDPAGTGPEIIAKGP